MGLIVLYSVDYLLMVFSWGVMREGEREKEGERW